MVVLGIVLLLIGWLVGISILETLGIILVVIGVVLLFVRPGGRRYY
jgi:hypothetical protein